MSDETTNLEPADLATLQSARDVLDGMLGDTDLAGDTSPEFRACQALSEILQAAPSPIPPNPNFYLNLHIDPATLRADRAGVYSEPAHMLTGEHGWATVYSVDADSYAEGERQLLEMVRAYPGFGWLRSLLGISE